MLDDDNRIAAIAQPVQDFQQVLDIMKVQAGRRLVEDIQRPARIALRQFLCELDALRLAARQSRRVLPEANVRKADIRQRLQFFRDHGHVPEELERVLDGHLEHFVNILALVANLERLPVVSLAAADVAGHVHVRQEVHLDLDDAVALAGFATSTLDVKTEAARHVAA